MIAETTPKTDRAITFDWGGSYTDFVKEADNLIKRHWREVGSHRDIIPLDPDHHRYLWAEQENILHVLKARWGGVLIGYFGVCITRHPRSKDIFVGTDEFIYVEPDYRKYGVGAELLQGGISRLTALGCHIIAFREKTRRAHGGYLKRFGFEPQETVYTKVVRLPEAKP